MSDDLIKRLREAVQTYPQMSEDEPGGYCTEQDMLLDEAADALEGIHQLSRALQGAHEARKEAQRQLERAQEQLRVAKDNTKDAERYRWILRNYLSANLPAMALKAGNLDAAIDAAIAASKGGA
jgi:hypothetical protein